MELAKINPLVFPNIDLSTFLSRPILLAFLVLFLIFYLIISAILFYHWRAYGMKNKGVLFAESVFFAGSVILFVIAGVSLFYY